MCFPLFHSFSWNALAAILCSLKIWLNSPTRKQGTASTAAQGQESWRSASRAVHKGILRLALYRGRQGPQLSRVRNKIKSCLLIKTNIPFPPTGSHLLTLFMVPSIIQLLDISGGDVESQLVLSRLESAKARQAGNTSGTNPQNENNYLRNITSPPGLCSENHSRD